MSLVRIKIKRDTAANYTASNIVLLLGEFAYETDTFTLSGGVRHYKFKIGDGSTAWNGLPYARLSAVGGGGASAFIDLTDVPGAYTGAGSQYVKVNETADGLEFEVIDAADLPTGIDAAKIADGSISNTEYQYLNGLSGNIQSQLDGKQASGNYFNKSADDTDDITEGTNKFATAAEKAKLANITITQAVDLDAIESRVNELDAAVVLKGSWDASAGTFPGAGVAQAGWSYVVSVSGTVDGVQFVAGDRIIALTDNASTTVYANNWLKADYSDLVTALDGTTGNLTLGSIIANLTAKTTPVDADTFALSDSENSNASKKFSWSNIKAAIKTYYDAVISTLTNKTINLANNTLTGTLAEFNTAISNDNIIPESGGTFTGDISVPAEAYGPGWNGSNEAPTKNDLYDKIETLGGGSLTNWTEARTASAPNATIPVVSFLPNTADTNNDGVFGAKGTGATLAQIPDSTTTGGDKRGIYAVDWQKVRSNSNHVASGDYSVIGGGLRNRNTGVGGVTAGGGDNIASGADYITISGGTTNTGSNTAVSIGGGSSNTAASSYATIPGGRNNTIPVNTDFVDSHNTICGGAFNTVNDKVINGTILGGRGNTLGGKNGIVGGFEAVQTLFGQLTFAQGKITTAGDRQHGTISLARSITGTAITELFLDASSLRASIGSNRSWNFEMSVVAIVKTVGNGTVTLGDTHGSNYIGTIHNIGGTTAIVGTVQQVGTSNNTTNMAGCLVTITADNTNDALKIEFTPATLAGSTTVTLVNCTIKIVEIAY